MLSPNRHANRFTRKSGVRAWPPGVYFRALLVGYFEGIDSERGIAWRTADSLALRSFLGFELGQSTPDHSTISRTRRLIDVETHRKVFLWVLGMLAEEGLLKGNTVAIDGTTLEANAALRSIVRRDNGQAYDDFLRVWRKNPASRRPPANSWPGWTASGRKRATTTTGRTRTIPMRRSQR